jgi:hypothetical protein
MTDQHVYEILSAQAKAAKSYFCIGVQEGGCLKHVLQANPSIEKIALCDTWGPYHGGSNRGSHDHIVVMLRQLEWEGEVVWLDGPSGELIPTLLGVHEFDLSYVDGAHDEASAYADLVNTWPLTRNALVLHDTNMPPVEAALQRFLLEMRDSRFTPSSHVRSLFGTGTVVLIR